MKTTAPSRNLRALRPADRLHARADAPARPHGTRLVLSSTAQNDFLVPNPRPDLVLDPQTLRMIDVR